MKGDFLMKKRNQLVGALLAGMLVGGMANTTVWAAADETGEVLAAEVQETSAPEAAEQQDSGSSGETEAQPSDDEPSQSEGTGESTAEDPSNTGTETKPDSGEGTGENQAGGEKTEPNQGAEVDPGQTNDAQKAAEEEQKKAAEEAARKAAEEAKKKAAEEAAKKAAEEAQKKAAEEAAKKAAEEAKKKAAEEAAKKSAQSAKNRQSRESQRSGGHRTDSYASYGRPIELTAAQKLQNMRLGFHQVAKKYGLVAVGSKRYLNIREDRDASARIIGTINDQGLVYVLEDRNDDWVYIESGDVRGFVMKKWLLIGEQADAVVREKGEKKLVRAVAVVDPLTNRAYRYSMSTVQKVIRLAGAATTANRQALIDYAMTFLGGRYVWGGDDPHTGADCSGFTRYVFAHFGIPLPRVSYEQCYAGTRIEAQEAKPGDLLFYARNGQVYHVLIYIGDGKAVNAQSTATGIVVSNVNYDKVCWGVRMINDAYTSTQASSLVETGMKATNGDAQAKQSIIEALAGASQKAYDEYGFPKSVLIAQAIQESGWLSFREAEEGGMSAADNNILGMNAELLNDQWTSPWTGRKVDRNVPQSVNGQTVTGIESMRSYEDIEACLEDYAAFKIGIHPDLRGSDDLNKVIDEGLEGYATDPTYKDSIRRIIDTYNLTQYDTGAANGQADSTVYTQDQLELIWAVTAQEDDTSYDGALAVISTVMNRADRNYGGYGTDALAQLTADGQFAYSPTVSDPSYYQRRLHGNVPDFVKQAVSDCLTRGIRNHNFNSFRSTNNGSRTRIGCNWYFNED